MLDYVIMMFLIHMTSDIRPSRFSVCVIENLGLAHKTTPGSTPNEEIANCKLDQIIVKISKLGILAELIAN